MDSLSKFRASGIIANYCLGLTTHAENRQVKLFSLKYPELQEEIERLHSTFYQNLFRNEKKPAAALKFSIMKTVYLQQSLINKKYLPLLDKTNDFKCLQETVVANNLKTYRVGLHDIEAEELPSTPEIANLAVWTKTGHTEEIHDDINEYIAVMEGSCTMYFGAVKKSYQKGDIIFIPPRVDHRAVVTSAQPMFALVQRHLLPM
ncbi:MAG: cupin domain-containing protein [Ferruginibacter sp.]